MQQKLNELTPVLNCQKKVNF